jgi:hypothetical protein
LMHICNATGASLPPLYVFEGKRRVVGLLNGAPPASAYGHIRIFYRRKLFACHPMFQQTHSIITAPVHH